MLEGRQQRRRQVGALNGDGRPELRVDYGWRLDGDLGRGRGLEPVHVRSHAHLPQPLYKPVGVTRRLDHGCQDGGPSLGGGELAIFVMTLGPGDAKGIR